MRVTKEENGGRWGVPMAGDDGPAGECRLCLWSGTNGAREAMRLPALEGGDCASGQGGLTCSQDGGLEERRGRRAERGGHVRSAD